MTIKSFLEGIREGNFHKITQDYEEKLLEVIEKEPAEYGYEFGRWTAARLATHLEQVTGIKLSSSQVRRRVERKKYVYRSAELTAKPLGKVQPRGQTKS